LTFSRGVSRIIYDTYGVTSYVMGNSA
jgi:hypothetical protein